MRNAGRASHFILIGLMAFFVVGRDAKATRIVFDELDASLETGSLAGTRFPVSFSYDADQVLPVGYSYIFLNSFDFTLLGVPFTRKDIFQGGQVIFYDGQIEDVTASFQVHLPPNSPVENITFGFKVLGIGYIDLNHQNGTGAFTIASTTVPEPAPLQLLLLTLLVFAGFRISNPTAKNKAAAPWRNRRLVFAGTAPKLPFAACAALSRCLRSSSPGRP